jgi:ribonuclease P protein component
MEGFMEKDFSNPTRIDHPKPLEDGSNPERVVLPIPYKEGTNRFFPKCTHIKKARDFREVFSKGEFFGGGYFKIGVLRNSLNYTRFGICVPKGTTRKATARNRLKRQIREVIRLNKDKVKQGFDIVLVLRVNRPKSNSGAHFDSESTPNLKQETIKNNILKVLFESGYLKPRFCNSKNLPEGPLA